MSTPDIDAQGSAPTGPLPVTSMPLTVYTYSQLMNSRRLYSLNSKLSYSDQVSQAQVYSHKHTLKLLPSKSTAHFELTPEKPSPNEPV